MADLKHLYLIITLLECRKFFEKLKGRDSEVTNGLNPNRMHVLAKIPEMHRVP